MYSPWNKGCKYLIWRIFSLGFFFFIYLSIHRIVKKKEEWTMFHIYIYSSLLFASFLLPLFIDNPKKKLTWCEHLSIREQKRKLSQTDIDLRAMLKVYINTKKINGTNTCLTNRVYKTSTPKKATQTWNLIHKLMSVHDSFLYHKKQKNSQD